MSGVCGNTQFQKHSLLGQQCISVAQAPTGKEAGFTRDGPCFERQSGDLLCGREHMVLIDLVFTYVW